VWAPRCPRCRRRAGEAVAVSASRSGVEGERAVEEPVVDAGEPQSVNTANCRAESRLLRLRHRRTAIAVAAVAVSVAVAAVAASLVSGGPTPGSPVAGLRGRIVAQSVGGQLMNLSVHARDGAAGSRIVDPKDGVGVGDGSVLTERCSPTDGKVGSSAEGQ